MKPDLPSSNAFWLLSTAYLDGGDTAHGLIRSGNYSGFAWLPCVFLYFRCIELALKAVLVSNGVAEQEIARTFGHRISALLIRTEEFTPLSDLGILPADRKLLDRFSDDYSDKWFEYPDKLWRGNPQLDQLKDLAHRDGCVIFHIPSGLWHAFHLSPENALHGLEVHPEARAELLQMILEGSSAQFKEES